MVCLLYVLSDMTSDHTAEAVRYWSGPLALLFVPMYLSTGSKNKKRKKKKKRSTTYVGTHLYVYRNVLRIYTILHFTYLWLPYPTMNI